MNVDRSRMPFGCGRKVNKAPRMDDESLDGKGGTASPMRSYHCGNRQEGVWLYTTVSWATSGHP